MSQQATAKVEQLKAPTNPVAVYFKTSINLVEERMSVSLGQTCDGIAYHEEKGFRGLRITKRHHDRNRNIAYIAATDVPWDHVSSVKLGE